MARFTSVVSYRAMRRASPSAVAQEEQLRSKRRNMPLELALAPASDLPALLKSGQGTLFGKIVSSYLIHAYATAYPDVGIDSYVHPRTRPFVGDVASRCAGGWPTLFSAAETKLFPSAGIFARDPASGPLGNRLRQNTPATTIVAE